MLSNTPLQLSGYSSQAVMLSNNVSMPLVGFGTYKIDPGETTYKAVRLAIDKGYRLIDTAAYYQNEHSVGRAVRDSGLNRQDVFITTKLWNTNHGFSQALDAFFMSLKQLALDYVDLYLIHWPNELQSQTWQAFEKLYQDGVIKAIGVSNYQAHHMDALLQSAIIRPMVNQIECHPLYVQANWVQWCQQHHIHVQARSPLMKGQVIDIDVINILAHKYQRTPAQIVLRWHIQCGLSVVPKSVNPNRIAENREIFDFELSDFDMKLIAQLDKNKRIGSDPDNLKLV
jgi:methylglyoxal/glyoxal reductase